MRLRTNKWYQPIEAYHDLRHTPIPKWRRARDILVWYFQCQQCPEKYTSEIQAGWHERNNSHQMEVVYPDPVLDIPSHG